MKLGESAKKFYDSSLSAKVDILREDHFKQMEKIGIKQSFPVNVNGKEEMFPIDPMRRMNMHAAQVKAYLKSLINARIDTFIEVHEMLDEAPHEEDVQEFINGLVEMSKGFGRHLPDYYKSAISPIPSMQLVDRCFDVWQQDMNTFPGMNISRLNAFVHKARLLKERKLSLRQPTSVVTNNTLYVGQGINGPVQVGAENSTQYVAIDKTVRQDLTIEQQEDAFKRLSEWLTNKIDTAGWFSYQEIADATGLEIWIVKECIEYAAFLAHLKVLMKHPASILLGDKLVCS